MATEIKNEGRDNRLTVVILARFIKQVKSIGKQTAFRVRIDRAAE